MSTGSKSFVFFAPLRLGVKDRALCYRKFMGPLKHVKVQHLMLAVVVLVVVPFLSWYSTWFGRPLSDQKITEYLADEKARRSEERRVGKECRL